MSSLEYYLVTVAVYGAINGILVLGLNMQFGNAGILNFAYMTLVAIGAYAAGIAGLAPAAQSYLAQYIGGFSWPFPWDILFGVAVTLIFAAGLGAIAFLRLRADYLALTLFSVGIGIWLLIDNYGPILNGDTGLIGIPGPWADQLDPATQQIVFLGICLACLGLVYWAYHRVDRSALGRAFRAIRDDELATASLGKNPWRLKMIAFLLGAAAAGLGGALFAVYLGGWGPSGWMPGENLILLASVIVGGRGRNLGVLIGSILLMEGIIEGARFIPVIANNAGLLPDLQGIAIGIIFLAIIWWRPQGLLPERTERFTTPTQAAPIELATAPK